ncbi:hypothetical protein DIPPA_70127 [Diplonema papillatum]|nr:hypothetical protein DIPPA_70127 [Diplonema papillatum]
MNTQMQKLGMVGVKHLLAISSCKGGVGKSTTAVNLALAFKNLGKSTGLLDMDLQGPSVPRMLNLHRLESVKATREGKFLPPQNYGIKAMSLGLLLADDQSMVARGPMLSQQVNALLQQVDWGNLDILCLDMPPGTHDVHLTISQQLSLDGAVIVTTPQEIATMDTRRGMDMFKHVHVPMLGLVENMSYFLCPNCETKHHIFGEEGQARVTAERFEIPFLGSVPFEVDNRIAADSGQPVTHLGEHGHRLAKPYYDIARKLIELLEAKKGDAPGKVSIEFED